MRTNARLLSAVCLMLGVSSNNAMGQDSFDWIEPNEKDCQRAELIMETVSAGQKRSRAMEYLSRRCGASGIEAVSQEFLTMGAVSDTVLLNDTVRELLRVRDALILSAAVELAAERSATIESRIAALRVVVTQIHPWYRAWFKDFELPSEGRLALQYGTIGPPIGPEHAVFPPGWREDTEAVVMRIMEDPSESDGMRWAANRGLLHVRSLGEGPGSD